MTLQHPRLVHALMALRPGTKPLKDFIVQDTGSGPTLVEGSMQNAPTQLEVDALTPTQLDDAKSSTIVDQDIERTNRVLIRVLLNHENRIRVVEGRSAVTMPQFLAALKSLS